MTAITITVVVLVAYFSVNKSRGGGGGKNGSSSGSGGDKKRNRSRGGQAPSDAADSSSSSSSSRDGGVPSIEELGVTPTENEAEVVYGLTTHPLAGVSNFGVPPSSTNGMSGHSAGGAAAPPSPSPSPSSSSSSSSSSWASFWPGASSWTGAESTPRRTGGSGGSEDGYIQA